MRFRVRVDFGAGYVDISEHCLGHTKTIGLHNGLMPVINTATFDVTDRDTANLFLASTTDLPVTMERGDWSGGAWVYTDWFYGYIRSNFTAQVGAGFDGIHIECVSRLMLLQKRITTAISWAGYTVCDRTDKTHSILHQLCYLAGIADADIYATITTISTVIDYFVVEPSENATYESKLSQLLFDLGYVYYTPSAGDVRVQNLYPTSAPSSITYDDEDLFHGLQPAKVPRAYEKVRLTWYPHKTLTNKAVFTDVTGADADHKCNIALGAGEYYPEGSDTSDVYCTFSVTDAELIIANTAVMDWTQTGVTLDAFTPGPKRALLQLHAASAGTITKLDIRANAIVRDLTKKKVYVREIVVGTEKVLDVEAWWITTSTQARRLANGLALWYSYANMTYSGEIDPDATINLGSICTLTEDVLGISQLVRIVQYTSNGDVTKTVVFEGMGAYTVTDGTTENEVTQTEAGHSSSSDDDDLTHEEDQTGYDDAGGTTVPTVPTFAATGIIAAACLRWSAQLNLTNWDHYDIQVDPTGGGTGYPLMNDGTGYDSGDPDGWTECQDTFYAHEHIPNSATIDAPAGTTYYYRVRQVTKAPIEGSWTGWVAVTTLVIGEGDLGGDIVTAAKIKPTEFLTLQNDGLVWYLPLDEEDGTVAADVSDSLGDATLYGAVAHAAGVAGRALTFGGVAADYVRSDAALPAVGSSWSISLWIHPTDHTADRCFIAKASVRIFSFVDNAAGKLWTYWYDSGGTQRGFGSVASIADGEWTHVVITHDDATTTTTLYLNGTLDKTTSAYDSESMTSSYWYVGKNATTSTRFFLGAIDEVRVYSRALSLKEVRYLYTYPCGAQYTQIDTRLLLADIIYGKHIVGGEISADKMSTGVLNTLIAAISSYLVVSSVGWEASTAGATPVVTDQRAYLDRNDVRLQYCAVAGAWADRISMHASNLTDDYTLTLTSCPLVLTTIKARTSAGLGIYEDSGAYGISVADDGSVTLTPKASAECLRLARVASTASIKGASTGTPGNAVILDGYGADDGIAALQYYVVGDVVLCYGGGTGGGTIGLGSTDLEAWGTGYLALEAYRSAIMFNRAGDSMTLLSNAYYDGAWKYKAAAAASRYRVTGTDRTFLWATVAAGSADGAITWQEEMSLVGGADCVLNLGGAAGGSNRDVRVYLATDVYLNWDEASSIATLVVLGTNALRVDNTGISPVSGTTASGANVFQNASGSYLLRSTSSLRYKADVADAGADAAALCLALRPIRFRSRCEADDQTILRFGFAAEEVDKLGYPGLVHYAEMDGKQVPDGVQYTSIIPLAVAAIQDHEARIRKLEEAQA